MMTLLTFAYISLSICILGTNTLAEATWIHSVGIQAAAQLITNLHDGNYTNIVLVDKWPHEDSDEIFAQLSQVDFQNMITVKNLRIRENSDLQSSISLESPYSTLFVTLDIYASQTILDSSNSTILSYNSWLMTILNENSQDPESYLRSLLEPYKNLYINSRLYFLVVNGTITQYNAALFEGYRVAPNQDLVINQIAYFTNGSYQFLKKQYIWDRREDMQGYKLKTILIPNKPFVYKEHGQWAGINVDILDIMKSTINFTYEMIERQDGVFGSYDNGTWTGLIGSIQHGEADFSISDLSVTQERARAVDFTIGIVMDSNKLFVKKPRRSVSWTTFMDAFSVRFMATLAGLFIMLSIIFYVIFLFVNGETTIDFGTSIATVFLSFMALEIPVDPNRVPGRTLTFTVCISGALIFWSYNAGLVSLLTVDNIQFPIKTMKDLAEKSQYNLIIQKGTAYEDFFRNSPKDSIEGQIWARVDQKRQMKHNIYEIEKTVLANDQDVYFGPYVNTLVAFDSVPCNVTTESPDYFVVSLGWAFQKHSPFLQLFNYHLTKAKETGSVQRILNKYISRISNVQCETSNFKEISIENIFTAFLILAIGALAAFVASIGERIYQKRQNKSILKTNKNFNNQVDVMVGEVKKALAKKHQDFEIVECDLKIHQKIPAKFRANEFRLSLFKQPGGKEFSIT